MQQPLRQLESEKNTKLNRLAKIGYFAAATIDPYGMLSLSFALLLWQRKAGTKQVGGFLANMLIHLTASAIFAAYFSSFTGDIVYSIIFATMIPIALYHFTKAPTLLVASA